MGTLVTGPRARGERKEDGRQPQGKSRTVRVEVPCSSQLAILSFCRAFPH